MTHPRPGVSRWRCPLLPGANCRLRWPVDSGVSSALAISREGHLFGVGMSEMEITVPEEVAVMTLPNTAFFPQALMPLHIFEPRYRAMLRDVLASNRLFAVAGLNPRPNAQKGAFEPPHRVASLGIVRACQKNDDGTSNLLLQGLCRVRILDILGDTPYRRVKIEALSSEAGGTAQQNEGLRKEIARLLNTKARLMRDEPGEMMNFLRTVHDPEAFIDIAAFSLCENSAFKQKLLETLDVRRRLQLFGSQLKTEIQGLKLQRKVQGHLPDDRVQDN